LFSGANPLNDFPAAWDVTTHHHILAGAIDVIDLENPEDSSPFRHAFIATTDGAVLGIESIDGATIRLRESTGQARLKIVDPATNLLFDRYAYAASELATVHVVPDRGTGFAEPNAAMLAAGIAFWPSTNTVGIALHDAAGYRLIDAELLLSTAGATQTAWDTLTLATMTLGAHAIDATTSAGDTFTSHFNVVNHVDSLAVVSADTQLICFAAYANGEYVANAPWAFEIDGIAVPQDDFISWLGQGCMLNTSPTHAMTAHLDGKSLTAIGTTAPAHADSIANARTALQ
jgi:hypothetical protein